MVPEYKDEQHEQGEEHRHVVHGAEHDYELSPKVWKKSDQLQNPQEPEGPQDGEAAALHSDTVENAMVDFKGAEVCSTEKNK